LRDVFIDRCRCALLRGLLDSIRPHWRVARRATLVRDIDLRSMGGQSARPYVEAKPC
jgi:hypothetical protein